MGAHLVRRYLGDAEVEPDPLRMPTFDPLYGLPERRERVMVATQEQMDAARLPLDQRDYCAHHLLRFLKCKRDYFPNPFACRAQRHEWDYCEHLDYVMRMKEFERERRLLARRKRLQEKARKEAMAA